MTEVWCPVCKDPLGVLMSKVGQEEGIWASGNIPYLDLGMVMWMHSFCKNSQAAHLLYQMSIIGPQVKF